jgi:hypothetical protein
MAREINYELKRQIYDCLEEQWYFYGEKPFEYSLEKISGYLKEHYNKEISTTMVLYYVRKLAEDGKIKFGRENSGNNANVYEIMEWGNTWNKKGVKEKNEVNEANEVKNEENNEETREDEEEMITSNNQLKINNLSLESAVNQIKETLGLIEKLKVNNSRYEYLKKALEGLKPIGTTIDKQQLFCASSNFNLIEILQLIGKNENRDHF